MRANPYHPKTQAFQRESLYPVGHLPGTSSPNRNSCLRNKSLYNGYFIQYSIQAERLYMKLNGRLYIGQGLFIRIALTNDHSLEPQRVGHISIRMLFNDNFKLPYHLLPPIVKSVHPTTTTALDLQAGFCAD